MSEKPAEKPCGKCNRRDDCWRGPEFACEKYYQWIEKLNERESAPETVKMVVCNEPENCGTVKELDAMQRETQRRLSELLEEFHPSDDWKQYKASISGEQYKELREAAEGRDKP